MKGILLKDFYTLQKQIPLFMFVAVMLSMLQGSFAIYATVYASLLPITAIAYDERSKWDTLAAAMPYTASEIVLSKYIVGWLSTAAAAVVSTAVRRVLFVISNGEVGDGGDVISIVLPGIAVGILILSIIMPIVIRFGVERGRLIYSLVLGLCVGIIAVLGRIAADTDIVNIPILNGYAYTICAVGIILFSAASVGIAVLFYKRKMSA